jgi:hypothetical protein
VSGSRSYTFDVPFMSPRATKLLDRLKANDWFRNVGRRTPLRLVGEEVGYRFAKSADEVRTRLRGLAWRNHLNAASNATTDAYDMLYGREWMQKHHHRVIAAYYRLILPIRRKVAPALAKAWDLTGDAATLLLMNMPDWLAAADLERKWRVEFLLGEAAIYLAGHVPCGWSGRDSHCGEFLVY